MFTKVNRYVFLVVFCLNCYLVFKLIQYRYKSAVVLIDQTVDTNDYNSYAHKNLMEKALPFIPINNADGDCDELFKGSHLDHFNFTHQYFKQLPEYKKLLKKWPFSGDGHAGLFPQQYKVLNFLSTQKIYHSYCETGFNYGHSSFSALTAQDDSKVLSLDIGYHDYTKKIMPFFEEKFKGRFTPVLGDSSVSLPNFIQNNPAYRCDVFFVDGSHTYGIGFKDLQHFASIAEKDNIMVFDDYPTVNNKFTGTLGKAWNQAVEEGWLKELMRCKSKTISKKGFCVGSFVKKA